ncbi:MAG: transposase [Deltaproteobacteria bacterium]|nr:transposase [Deltaproteobacteria bacterium]
MGKIDRKGLEKLCRYLVRPPLSAQRLELAGGGQVRVHLKNEWSGGVKSVLMPESDLVLRLRASVPLPRRC